MNHERCPSLGLRQNAEGLRVGRDALFFSDPLHTLDQLREIYRTKTELLAAEMMVAGIL